MAAKKVISLDDFPKAEDLPEEVPKPLRDTIQQYGPAMKEIHLAFEACKRGEITTEELEKRTAGPCDVLIKGATFLNVLMEPEGEEEKRAHNSSLSLTYRTLGNVSRILGRLQDARKWLYKVLEVLGDITQGLEIFQLEAAIELGCVLHELRLTKEIKRNLKLCKELHDRCRSKNEADFLTPDSASDYYSMYYIMLQKMLEVKNFDSPAQLIDALHVTLLRLYQRYYAEIHIDMEKVVHNGFLVLKYELKYNLLQPSTWIEHATELSAYSMEVKAFKQSHYLLRAAQAMLDKEKSELNVQDLAASIGAINDHRYLQGCIDLGVARHCLLLIYETRNRQLIRERAKSLKKPLSKEDEKDLEIKESLVEFEDFEVPPGDDILNRLCFSVEEIVKMHCKIKDLLVSVNENLTESERESRDYEAIVTKCRELKDAYAFLD